MDFFYCKILLGLISYHVFPGSSSVEHLAVNQVVVGSIPTRGAIYFFLSIVSLFLKYVKLFVGGTYSF